MNDAKGEGLAQLDAKFKLLFISSVLITIGMLIANGVLVFTYPELNQNQQELVNNISKGWQLGIAAILGLIGGKAT